MGYTTSFTGQFDLGRRLTPEHEEYLRAFNGTRRMGRIPTSAALRSDPVRTAAGLPIGSEGAYFVGTSLSDVLDCNKPPAGQPGLWCGWTVRDGGLAICWDESEKFYDYVEWIKYLITHFLGPWGYVLSGSVRWEGEQQGDVGTIAIVGNVAQVAT